MKLRNKKTGEIGYLTALGVIKDDKLKWYENLADVNDEWEDYEEPKHNWYINDVGEVEQEGKSYVHEMKPEKMKVIGNYFETKGEAEKAVEKLKAWKRLKDKGFRFVTWDDRIENENLFIVAKMPILNIKESQDDLDLLFGGEE